LNKLFISLTEKKGAAKDFEILLGSWVWITHCLFEIWYISRNYEILL